MTQPPGTWHNILRSYPCEACDAGPGEPCVTASGRKSALEHSARQHLVGRCPRCSGMLDADHPPGTLCPHCALVRSLNIERHTTHRRRSP